MLEISCLVSHETANVFEHGDIKGRRVKLNVCIGYCLVVCNLTKAKTYKIIFKITANQNTLRYEKIIAIKACN